MEKLSRGFIGMKTPSGVFFTWRSLKTDPGSIFFQIYKDGFLLAEITGRTNYLDETGQKSSSYSLVTVIDGTHSQPEETYFPILEENEQYNGNFIDFKLNKPAPRPTILFRNPREDLYHATGKYYYTPISRKKMNDLQETVSLYRSKRLSKQRYEEKVSQFEKYFCQLGLDETGGEGPTLRTLGYNESGKVPYRLDKNNKLSYQLTDYTVSDMSIGDLDGDGNYELIVKWDPDNSQDSMISYLATAPCIIDAYKINHSEIELMWRVDVGYNMKTSAHTSQILVYDFDGDGRAEMMIRTVDGTTSGQVVKGKYVPTSFVGPKEAANIEEYIKNSDIEHLEKYTSKILNSATVVWEDPVYNNGKGEAGQEGYISVADYSGNMEDQDWVKAYVYGPSTGKGAEYISIFEGTTGKIIDSIAYKYTISEDMWGINPSCRRGAECKKYIRVSDEYHKDKDSDYVTQDFWTNEKNDIGNNEAMFGDSTGNHAERFLATVAFLDGKVPCAVFGRGYYNRTTLAAYQYRNQQVILDSTFDSLEFEDNYRYEYKGNHNLAAADVDNDGCDEILYGAITFEKNDKSSKKIDVKYLTGVALPAGGQPKINTVLDVNAGIDQNDQIKKGYKYFELCHGDSIHLLPLDKTNRLVLFTPHEEYGNETDGWGVAMDVHDAATGKILTASFFPDDQGRGVAGNVDPRRPDRIIASGNISIDLKTKEKRENGAGNNFLLYWTGSLVAQKMDQAITQIGADGLTEEVVMEFPGTATINGTKSNPCLQADFLGDWREEVIRLVGRDKIRIFTTNMPTEYQIPALMQDHQYQLGVVNENICYNQPPHPGFFLGYEAGVSKVINKAGTSKNKIGSLIPDTDPIISL